MVGIDDDSQARWESFLDALMADRELLTKRIRENIRPELPGYRLVASTYASSPLGFWFSIQSRRPRSRGFRSSTYGPSTLYVFDF